MLIWAIVPQGDLKERIYEAVRGVIG